MSAARALAVTPRIGLVEETAAGAGCRRRGRGCRRGGRAAEDGEEGAAEPEVEVAAELEASMRAGRSTCVARRRGCPRSRWRTPAAAPRPSPGRAAAWPAGPGACRRSRPGTASRRARPGTSPRETHPGGRPLPTPKSSASSSSDGMAAQFTATNGPRRRDDERWSAERSLLADAGLADHEHGQVGVRDLLHARVELGHHRRRCRVRGAPGRRAVPGAGRAALPDA